MSRTEPVELTTLCMICQGNRILLQNRIKSDWHGWTLPGGHVEPDESIVDAVCREMKEETGLTIFSPRLCGLKQFPTENGRYLVLLFKADRFEGELVSSNEGKMEWFDRKDIPRLHTVEDFSELLSVMDSDALNEFLYVPHESGWQVVLR